MDVEIVLENYPNYKAKILNKPFLVVLEDIDGEHQHIDFQYVCRLKREDKLSGTEEYRWFDEKELDNLENCSDGIKHFAKEARRYIKMLPK